MNAELLVDLLLEMNVINPGDIDREINKLAARLTDPRAQKWFTRVPRYFIINIDQLAKEPFIAKAKPRTNAGTSKYNFHPEKGWEPGQEPNDIPASEWEEKEYAGDPDACSRCNGTGKLRHADAYELSNHETRHTHSTLVAANPEHDPAKIKATYVECPACKGTGTNPTPEFNNAKQALTRWSIVQSELNKEQAAEQSKLDREHELLVATTPKDQRKSLPVTAPVAKKKKAPTDEIETLVGKIKGLRQKRSELREESLEEGYDPEKQTFTTNDPFAEQDIKQSFSKFDPKSAKEKSGYGEPPSAGELPGWMTEPGSKDKEFHYFDPIQVRRRDLFSRLDNLVNYLNYQAVLIRRGSRPEADDEAKSKGEKAEKLMQRLSTMKTEDIHGFREVVRSALNFTEDAKTKPWLFTGDAKEIARHGNLTLRKVIYLDTAMDMSKRAVDTSIWTNIDCLKELDTNNRYGPAWCTSGTEHTSKYLTNPATNTPVAGPALYFIDKHNMPYALAHFPTSQLRNPYNLNISNEMVNEIAPLFINEQRFPGTELQIMNARLAVKVEYLKTIQQA